MRTQPDDSRMDHATSDSSVWRDLWRAAAERFADLTALETPSGKVSYRQLSDEALCVTRELSSWSGWVPGACVAVPSDQPGFVQRCVGVWLAHGIAVPFNRAHFETTPQLEESVSRIVDLSLDPLFTLLGSPRFFSEGSEGTRCRNHAIFFTSGSSGAPKAVVRGWTQALFESARYREAAQLYPGRRTTMLIDPAFGASTKHLLGCLLGGSCQRLSWWERPEGLQSDVLYGTPSQVHLLAELSSAWGFFSLVSTTGEALTPRVWSDIQRISKPGGLSLNALGGTEFGVLGNDVRSVTQQFNSPRVTPIEGKIIEAVDEDGVPVPRGLAGRIRISSHALAEGYLETSDPGFCFKPLRSAKQDRALFTSDDIGIITQSGEIEIVGRASAMVKRHGRWVDTRPLSEHALTLPGVTACHIDISSARGEVRLWLECPSGDATQAASIRALLLESFLGSPLLPGELRIVSAFPRNRHGKTDIRGLQCSTSEKVLWREEWNPVVLLARAISGSDDCSSALAGDSSLEQLGLDSVTLHELALCLSQILGRRVLVTELLPRVPMKQLRAWLLGASNVPARRALSAEQPHAVLLWFGDGVVSVSRALPQEVELQHVDIDSLISPEISRLRSPMSALVEKVLDECTEALGRPKLFLGGFSFGAVLAAAVAGQLEAQGVRPALTFMVDPPRQKLDAVRASIRASRAYTVWIMSRLVPGLLRTALSKRITLEVRRRALMNPLPACLTTNVSVFSNQRYKSSLEPLLARQLGTATVLELPTRSHLAVVHDPNVASVWLTEIAGQIRYLISSTAQ